MYPGMELQRAQTHKGLNRYTQGSAADLMKTAMVLIWESGLLDESNEIRVSLTVHDELDGCIAPTERGRTSLKELERFMEEAAVLAVPVVVESKTGRNWAETH